MMDLGYKKIIFACILIALLVFLNQFSAFASPGYLNRSRSPEFAEAPEMRSRVQFWIDIFTRYGENSVVFHHRDYPGITFGALNFEREAARFSDRQLAAHVKAEKKRYEQIIRSAFARLSTGAEPKSELEHSIANQMRVVPGGNSKYQKVIKDKLIRGQTGIKEKFEKSLIRSGRYMPTLEKIFSEYGLPTELTRIPFVESSFDYKAYSSVGAAGIWQFMPRTARLFGLKRTSAIDERRDPVEATKAAAKYLLQAYNELGSWPLAITSYNHGIYGVKKAVRTMGTTDISRIVESHGKRPFGFASNNFYAEFLAALQVYENHYKYFPDLVIESPLRFEEVQLANSYTVQFASKDLGVSLDALQPLNYAISASAWRGAYSLPRGYVLKVPPGAASRASRLKSIELAEISPERTASSIYGGATHRVRSGENLALIAKRYGTTIQDLTSINNLDSTDIRTGQLLIVKRKDTSTPRKGFLYIVRKGDNLGKIATKFKVSVNSVRQHNRLRTTTLRVGQKLRISGSPFESVDISKPASRDVVSGSKTKQKRVYRVKSGDSLWSVGRKYGVSISDLKQTNKLKKNSLRVGDSLIIP